MKPQEFTFGVGYRLGNWIEEGLDEIVGGDYVYGVELLQSAFIYMCAIKLLDYKTYFLFESIWNRHRESQCIRDGGKVIVYCPPTRWTCTYRDEIRVMDAKDTYLQAFQCDSLFAELFHGGDLIDLYVFLNRYEMPYSKFAKANLDQVLKMLGKVEITSLRFLDGRPIYIWKETYGEPAKVILRKERGFRSDFCFGFKDYEVLLDKGVSVSAHSLEVGKGENGDHLIYVRLLGKNRTWFRIELGVLGNVETGIEENVEIYGTTSQGYVVLKRGTALLLEKILDGDEGIHFGELGDGHRCVVKDEYLLVCTNKPFEYRAPFRLYYIGGPKIASEQERLLELWRYIRENGTGHYGQLTEVFKKAMNALEIESPLAEMSLNAIKEGYIRLCQRGFVRKYSAFPILNILDMVMKEHLSMREEATAMENLIHCSKLVVKNNALGQLLYKQFYFALYRAAKKAGDSFGRLVVHDPELLFEGEIYYKPEKQKEYFEAATEVCQCCLGSFDFDTAGRLVCEKTNAQDAKVVFKGAYLEGPVVAGMKGRVVFDQSICEYLIMLPAKWLTLGNVMLIKEEFHLWYSPHILTDEGKISLELYERGCMESEKKNAKEMDAYIRKYMTECMEMEAEHE